jgi:uncharacterized protein YsxB (DUF464 family)
MHFRRNLRDSEFETREGRLLLCAGADAIVFWNFQHIVRLAKIKVNNEVNRALTYAATERSTLKWARSYSHKPD